MQVLVLVPGAELDAGEVVDGGDAAVPADPGRRVLAGFSSPSRWSRQASLQSRRTPMVALLRELMSSVLSSSGTGRAVAGDVDSAGGPGPPG